MGVFEFGRAITYWHDLNNTAQVAARYAVVNRYPGCPADVPGAGFSPGRRAISTRVALRNGQRHVTVCYRDDDGSNSAERRGSPHSDDDVHVQAGRFLRLANITLRGKATLAWSRTTRRTSTDSRTELRHD